MLGINKSLVLCRFLNVRLNRLMLVELYKENYLSLDDLGSDILSMLKTHEYTTVYEQSILKDILFLHKSSLLDVSKEQLIQELYDIKNNVLHRLKLIHIKGRLINLYFDNPDTMIFEFIHE